ncbi:hypothetical protein JCM3766R1_001795 [Sporobolomyces carnicolor]
MSLTTDQNKLFRTDAQHRQEAIRVARAEALQNVGAPIQIPSKPLRVVVKQPRGNAEPDAFVAESGWVLRRVGLQSGKTKQLFKGHCGPVTCLDFYTTKTAKRELLISGSWDKSFKVWDLQTKAVISTTVAHTDFIKTLVVIPELDVLVTGSSDKDLRIWDLSTLDAVDYSNLASPAPAPVGATVGEGATSTSQEEVKKPQGGAAPPAAISQNPLPLLTSLKSHTRPIERLAYFSILSGSDESGGQPEGDRTGKTGLVSTDSMGVLKVWELGKKGQNSLEGVERCSVRHHELAIYDLVVSAENGEIWTASADNSILLMSFSPSDPASAPVPTLRIPHPAQTRSVLPLHLEFPNFRHVVTTTITPEELIRVWDLDSEDLEPDAKREVRRDWKGLPASYPTQAATTGGGADERLLPGCVREVEGHTNDVVSLSSYVVENEEGKKEIWILSASLDGTLRRWNWVEMLERKRDKIVLIETTPHEDEEPSLLTEEEERELEELMADD